MHWVFLPVMVLYLAAGIISGIIAYMIWRRRTSPGAHAFMSLMLAVSFWAIIYGVEICSADLIVRIILMDLRFIALAFVPVMWLAFAFQFTGQEGPRYKRWFTWVLVIPLITLILQFSNPLHGWMRTAVALIMQNGIPIVEVRSGPWFWFFLLYTYIVLLVGALVLAVGMGNNPQWRYRQTMPLLISVLLPWLANGLYVFHVFPGLFVDLTPLIYTFSGVLSYNAVFRHQLRDMVPVAHSLVLERMNDGVIVIDDRNRVVEINPSAAGIVSAAPAEIIGKPIQTVLKEYPDLTLEIVSNPTLQTEVLIHRDGREFFYDLRVSQLVEGREEGGGKLVVFRDITHRLETERALANSNALLMAIFEATADALLVTDAEAHLIRYNRRFVDLWRLPREIDELPQTDPQKTVYLFSQLVHPEPFIRLMSNLVSQPDTESYDVLEFKDGRFIERTSRPQRVGGQIVGRVWSFRDISEQRQTEDRLRYSSTHDTLTQLYNRSYFETELSRLEGSRQFPVSLIMADVDGLKQINDTLGHAKGDLLLVRAARVLRQACRSEDVVARIGGDEFGVILPLSTNEVAERAIERINNLLAINRVGENDVPLSISLGAATAENSEMLRHLVRQADKEMYGVKRGKRMHRINSEPIE